MVTALVTGADGFIGSHLTEFLVEKGYKVRALCQYNSFGHCGWLDSINKKIFKDIDIIFGDIRDYQIVEKAVKNIDVIFHLAALISIPYSYEAPFSYLETNVKGTLNILNASKKNDVKRVIHTSTSETYGTAQYVPIDEKHPLTAQSPYAASKIGADQFALSYWRSFSTPVTILRPFNTYGPRQSNRAIIPTVITQILKKKDSIKVGNLNPTRDFNYIKDTCMAFHEVSLSESCLGEVLNSSSRFEISIEETISLIKKIMNSNIEIEKDNQKVRPEKSEVERLFGDNRKILSLTNWRPKYSGLHGFHLGLKETIEWFSDEKNLEKYNSNLYVH